MDNDNDSSMTAALDDCEARRRRLAFQSYLDAHGVDGRDWFSRVFSAGHISMEDRAVLVAAADILKDMMSERQSQKRRAAEAGGIASLGFESLYLALSLYLAQNDGAGSET